MLISMSVPITELI